jgi:hypothetical protein
MMKRLEKTEVYIYFVVQSAFYLINYNQLILIIMTWQSELQQILQSKTLIKRALQGAGIALILICIFILGAATANAEFGSWVVWPILAVTAGGAGGGIFYCLMDLLRTQGGWKKALANIASILVYIAALYCSLILALSALGLWD